MGLYGRKAASLLPRQGSDRGQTVQLQARGDVVAIFGSCKVLPRPLRFIARSLLLFKQSKEAIKGGGAVRLPNRTKPWP
eukprot:5310652-Prymnesium_polylepis.1